MYYLTLLACYTALFTNITHTNHTFTAEENIRGGKKFKHKVHFVAAAGAFNHIWIKVSEKKELQFLATL